MQPIRHKISVSQFCSPTFALQHLAAKARLLPTLHTRQRKRDTLHRQKHIQTSTHEDINTNTDICIQ